MKKTHIFLVIALFFFVGALLIVVVFIPSDEKMSLEFHGTYATEDSNQRIYGAIGGTYLTICKIDSTWNIYQPDVSTTAYVREGAYQQYDSNTCVLTDSSGSVGYIVLSKDESLYYCMDEAPPIVFHKMNDTVFKVLP